MAEVSKESISVAMGGEELTANKPTVRLVSPLPPPDSAYARALRIKVFNVPPSEICSLDDLRQFLNGATSRLLDLDIYYQLLEGEAAPSYAELAKDDHIPPVKAVGNLNTVESTCMVDVSFMMAGVALRNLQGLPCFGRPLIFQSLDDAPGDGSDSDVASESGVPLSLLRHASHAGVLWLSGVNPYSDGASVKEIICQKVRSLQVKLEDSSDFDLTLDALYLPTNRVTGRLNGIGVIKLKVTRKRPLEMSADRKTPQEAANLRKAADYNESAFLVSSVRGLSRLLHDRIVDHYHWISIPFLSYQAHSIQAFRETARSHAMEATSRPKQRLFEITRECEDVEIIDKYRSMTSKIFGDNLAEGLIVQKSRQLGVRPSRILQLTGIAFSEDLLSPDTVLELARAVYSEFKKHAKVVQIVIPVPLVVNGPTEDFGEENEELVKIDSPPGTGKIFVEVVELYGARKLQSTMNGVTFDIIRTCAVTFFPETLFMRKQLTTADNYYKTLNPIASADESRINCFIPAKKGKLGKVVWGTAGLHKVPGSSEIHIEEDGDEKEDVKVEAKEEL
eukprot:GHVH01006408.1.p1 GENE.GHVH01006408.1~~GHVH01006408.1.p1  ORF type:complete len:572 (+),score=97.34 GHVH01006408.1:30-1718(+)